MSLVSPAAGVAMALSNRKKKNASTIPAPYTPVAQGPGNSSLYNNSPGG